MKATVTGLMAEERTSVTPSRPLTRDPKELGYKVELITAEELKKLMDEGANLLVVDTQDEWIYPVKHIKGAINFPCSLAKKRGLLGFTAEVLMDNRPMLHLCRKMRFDMEQTGASGVYNLKMMFRKH